MAAYARGTSEIHRVILSAFVLGCPASCSPDHGGACFIPNAPVSRRARRRQARCAPPLAVTFGQA